jgi:hypothetical protein
MSSYYKIASIYMYITVYITVVDPKISKKGWGVPERGAHPPK